MMVREEQCQKKIATAHEISEGEKEKKSMPPLSENQIILGRGKRRSVKPKKKRKKKKKMEIVCSQRNHRKTQILFSKFSRKFLAKSEIFKQTNKQNKQKTKTRTQKMKAMQLN